MRRMLRHATLRRRPLLSFALALAALLVWHTTTQSQAPAFDTVIRGGHVVDGTGNPWFSADVGIRGDTIVAVAPHLETAGARMKTTAGNSGTQAGDPVRAAEAMIRLTESASPPRHLVLGAFGFEAVTERMRSRLKEIEASEAVSRGADYPAGE